MDPDTAIGGRHGRFPETRRSLVLAAASADAGEREWAFEVLVAQYWKPVYKHLRRRHRCGDEDAKDLTQGFFLHVLDREVLGGYDAEKGSLRTFLRTCLDRFVANERKAAGRQKRGGGRLHLALDFEDAEGELRTLPIEGGLSPDEVFQREWVRSFFALAVEALRGELGAAGKAVHFALFEGYDLDPPAAGRPSYAELAAAHGLKVTDVTNHLHAVRRRFRRLVLEKLRESTASEAELEREARALLGPGAP